MEYNMKIIGHIENAYDEKFGVPRQSGLVNQLESRIVFEPEYRVREAFRGLEEYSHIWLIWVFSEAVREQWSPTVRPPRLGGNKRMGVFSTRSPFRPNPVGISSVRLERIEYGDEGPVLYVTGADLMNGTPILDVKPYLPYADSHPDASNGFALSEREGALQVIFGDNAAGKLSDKMKASLSEVLSQDPRPRYKHDSDKIYMMKFGGMDISFSVNNDILTVIDADKCSNNTALE